MRLSRRFPYATFCALIFSASTAIAAETKEPLPWDNSEPLPRAAADLLQDRRYDEAAAALAKAAAVPGAPRDRLLYAQARALHFAGKFDDAANLFASIERDFPKSPCMRRARFARGVALAKKGDFASAELIYRAEAEYLLSHERKQELADVYLDFARRYATPKTEQSPPDQPPPDYAKALEFFRQALELGPKPELRPEIEIQMADCRRLSDNFGDAANGYSAFVKDRPDHPRQTEARYRLGECRQREGNQLEARRVWQDLAALWPGDKRPPGAEQAEFLALAVYSIASTYGIPNPADDDDLALGIAALEAFLKQFPEHRLAGEAQLQIVRSRIARGRFAEAVAAAERFLSDAKNSDAKQSPDVRNLLGLAQRQQGKFVDALATWRDFLVKHPSHPAWNDVQQQIIETEYLMGAEAFRKKDYAAARTQWNEFLARYPLDPRSAEILFQFGRAEYLNDRFEAAISEWRRLISKYPGTEPASRAQFAIAAVYEEKLGKPIEAMQEYRKVTWGPQVNAAQARLSRLTAKQLEIVTERVFRTDEPARIALKTRNVDVVDVRLYTIDLETYFRKMHLAQGVESLDLALIDPNRTLKHAIADYADFKPCESAIELAGLADEKASAKPGVVVATVASKTHEATTLVIRSDLDIIVKSSRDEVFVFAENMRTGKAWPGARVLISDGSEIVGEGATGPDGTFRANYKQLEACGDVRVFAVADGHTASNVVSLSGVGVGQGLERRGFVYTDRNGYQPGQTVHVRAALRAVAGDRYVAAPKTKYRLEVFDPRNRAIHFGEATTGEFGSLHSFFALPDVAPPGEYRIQLTDSDGRSFAGTFQVANYSLEPVRLTIDLPRKVYYRGEEVVGTIQAAFYYGTPLAGREVQYSIDGGETITGTTDAQGKIAFKFPTRDYRELQSLSISAVLPERNLHAAEQVLLAVRAFSIGVTTTRDVVTVGESFAVTVKTTSADGKPTGEKLKLQVVELTKVDGEPGEKIISTHDIATDDKTGEGRLTLSLDKGARYALRVEGRDRFANPVGASREILISGDDDSVRLRILADKHNYKLGDEAMIRVHWRERPTLALVTFQGAKILDYRLVELKTGDNVLDVPMSDALAPNFHLEVNVMTDVRTTSEKGPAQRPNANKTRLHTATNEFFVDRELSVALEVKRKPGAAAGSLQPGETVDVVVRTLDPRGKPVAAEVAVALVDRQNVDRFGAAGDGWRDAFAGQYRRPAMRTMSSISFVYSPATLPINARLLSEEQRLEIAEQEEELKEVLAKSTLAGNQSFGGVSGADVNGFVAGSRFELGVVASPAPVPALGAILDGAQAAKPQSAGEPAAADAYGLVLESRELAQRRSRVAGEKRKDTDGAEGQMDARLAFGDKLERGADDLASLADNRWSIDAKQLTNRSLQEFYFSGGRELTVVQRGVQLNVRLAEDLSSADSTKVLQDLRDGDAVILLTAEQLETAYWNPSVVTDAAGSAQFSITLPERSTSWKLAAKGLTVDSATGEASEDVVVKKDLFGELALPAVVTDGDSISAAVTIHDDRPGVAGQAEIEVTLTTKIGDKKTEEKKTVDGGSGKLLELAFPIAAHRPAKADREGAKPNEEVVEVTLTVASGNRRDVVRRTVPIRPYGYSVFSATGGTATSDTTVWLDPPAGMQLDGARLEVTVGATMDRSLLDIVLGRRSWCEANARYASPLETSTSDLLAALALQKLVAKSRDQLSAEAVELGARVRSTIGYLAAAQNDDGGWSWTGMGGTSDRGASARVVWALSAARAAAYIVPQDCYDKAVAYLATQLAAVADDDLEGKAMVLHALAEADRGDFAVANRLFRSRTTISTAGAAYLALALAKMDHGPMAADLINSVKSPEVEPDAGASRLHSSSSRAGAAEVQGLFALAMQRSGVASPKLKAAVERLIAARLGNRWSPDKATGPATAALAGWFAENRPGGERYQLKLIVNDREVKTWDIDPTGAPQSVEVPAANLVAGRQRIQFQMIGRGHLAFQCALGGFVPADKLASTAKTWRVRRRFEPAAREFDGRELPRGFNVVAGSYDEFINPLTQLPIGKRGRVNLTIWRVFPERNVAEDKLEYLIAREPLPAGTSVVEQTIRGSYERYELLPGEIVFYIGNRLGIGDISFETVGASAGKYRCAPTMIFDAYRPERFVVDDELTKLTVLARGKASVDVYRWSPDELFELGKRHFAKRDWAAARLHLTELLKDWTLETAPYQESLRMLLDVHLELGPPAEIVRYFELVKEKSPDLEITFDKILKVGAAYHELGEYERSYLVFRATVEGSFLADGAVAGFLESQSEFLRSVEVMRRLIREYPPEPYAAAAEYALAQQVYGYAPSVAGDAKLRKRKLTPLALVSAAQKMLDEFLTEHPDDPAADQAAFAQANALLELEQFDLAVARCESFAKRYPESDFLDSYWYIIGYAHFAAGRPDDALATCRKVAEMKRTDKTTGRTVESRNRERAIYILGQVYHSLGKAGDAIREYLRVADQIPDAKKAIEYFSRRAIKLPDVLTIRPGEPAAVKLDFRNVPKVDVRAYRIDLMKFSLLRQNLEAITQINLAGIRPLYETTIELGNGKDYRDRERTLTLPLKDEGAYLVVCRGDNLHASGFVLISPLALEVQEDPVSGQVRTTVKNAVTEKYAADVHVKVIGTRDGEFKAGETDLRGVFAAEPISGRATVIAQSDDNRYAFYRGERDLLPQAAQAGQAPASQPVERQHAEKAQAGKAYLLEELNSGNGLLQRQQIDNLRNNYYNNRNKGVKAKAAY